MVMVYIAHAYTSKWSYNTRVGDTNTQVGDRHTSLDTQTILKCVLNYILYFY